MKIIRQKLIHKLTSNRNVFEQSQKKIKNNKKSKDSSNNAGREEISIPF